MRQRRIVLAVGAMVFVAACGGLAHDGPRHAAQESTQTVPPPSTEGAVRSVTADDLGASWHPGCPVEPDDLRLVGVTYFGTDGQPHTGQLVVNQDRVQETIAVFDRLYGMRYPIHSIRTPDHYPGADDELSMEDDNTSAFNCRGIPGSDQWSQHAWGRAVDINPLVNPSVYENGRLEPKTAATYVDRTRDDPGLLHDDAPAVHAFTDHGWSWGGEWKNPRDYQHFEMP